MTAKLPPLPEPDWIAIDTPGADYDTTFVKTEREAADISESTCYETSREILFSEAKLRAYAEEAVRVAVGEVQKDAERYRALRNGLSDWHGDCYVMTFDVDGDFPVVGADMDARVDRMAKRLAALNSEAAQG